MINTNEITWGGNVGSVELTRRGLLRFSVCYQTFSKEEDTPSKPNWMTCMLTIKQTELFKNKIKKGDSISVKGSLAIGEFESKKTITLFVKQIVELQPREVRNLTSLFYKAKKSGNTDAIALMNNGEKLQELFLKFLSQQMVQQPAQHIVQQPAQHVVQQPAQHVVQQPAQQVVQQPAQQEVQQPAQQVVQPAQQVVQPAQQVVQSVQQVIQSVHNVAQSAQQVAQTTPSIQTSSTNVSSGFNSVELNALPEDLKAQILAYSQEGGKDVVTPNFNQNQIEPSSELSSNAASIAAQALDNSDNFYNQH